MKYQIDMDDVIRRYLAGENSVEIARSLGCHPTNITRLLHSRGVTLRRNQPPYRPPTTYRAFHYNVRRIRGTPQFCEDCGSTDPSRRYEWASISHNYADVNDYKRLCKSCHLKFDGIKPNELRRGKPRPDISKLTADDIRDCIRRHSEGTTFVALAREFGVHHSTISSAVRRKSYRHMNIETAA